MMKTIARMAACTTLLWAGTALAAATAQQNCDYARIKARAKYVSCVDAAVAKVAKGVSTDQNPAFAKCRHTYFKNWSKFQTKSSLAGSTCVGNRFTEPSPANDTVTDNLTGLVWEKKVNPRGGPDDQHDVDTTAQWSAGPPWSEGQAFTFPLALSLFGDLALDGTNDWRLPTLAELQTIVKDFTCTGTFSGPTCLCSSSPCVDPALDAANTQPKYYWSATGYVTSNGGSCGSVGPCLVFPISQCRNGRNIPCEVDPACEHHCTAGRHDPCLTDADCKAIPTDSAWVVDFDYGYVTSGNKTGNGYVRAVRGGL